MAIDEDRSPLGREYWVGLDIVNAAVQVVPNPAGFDQYDTSVTKECRGFEVSKHTSTGCSARCGELDG